MSIRIPVVAMAALAVCGAAVAGPLNPPAGPVASTGKTLTEVEPRILVNQTNTPGTAVSVFAISQPGSYYLGADVVGEANKDGIIITSANVTLDLNGFSVSGVTDAQDGIDVTNFTQNVVIRNGHVRQWPGNGIEANIDSGRIENITSVNNGGWGIVNSGGTFTTNIVDCEVQNNGSQVADTGGIFLDGSARAIGCQVYSSTGTGILTSNDNVQIIDCTVSVVTGGDGIAVERGSLIEGCVVSRVTAGAGIRAEAGSVVRDCVVDGAETGGFVLEDGALGDLESPILVENCVAREINAGDGFFALNGGVVRGCIAQGCFGDGFDVRDAVVVACMSRSNGGWGFFFNGDGSSTARDCDAFGNTSGGFLFQTAATAAGCTASGNQDDGFRSSFPCNLRDCQADRNITDGFDFDGLSTGTRLNGCTATGNLEWGIRAGISARVEGCVANSNNSGGIRVDNHGEVVGCKTNENGGPGISLGGNASALGNVSKLNSGAGVTIFLAGGGTCKITGNTLGSNGGGGIVLPAGTNSHTVVKNVGQGITDSSAGSIVGPLNDLNNPWSNFTQ